MSLTTNQLTRLRRDLGDYTNAFTDAHLEDNWVRVAAAKDENTQHEATLALCFRQLLAGSVKLHDFEAGALTHKMDQVWKHIQAMFDQYKPALETVFGNSIGVVRTKVTPRRPDRRTLDDIN